MAVSCQQAADWIENALEGTLSPRHARELQDHLRECSRCRQRYRQETLAVKSLALMPHPDPPADLAERVMEALPPVSPRLLGQLAAVMQRAALDDDLRRRLRQNPQPTLLSMGVALPPGVRVEIVSEQTAPLPSKEVLYLPLPEAPLQLQELEQRLAAMGLGALFGLWW
ncbi:MAG: zf-HC2 domain-containing protein [Chloroflexia bacterium]|nr:zf-HC2 domain-containing protein [Chloroflexia bacterium]